MQNPNHDIRYMDFVHPLRMDTIVTDQMVVLAHYTESAAIGYGESIEKNPRGLPRWWFHDAISTSTDRRS